MRQGMPLSGTAALATFPCWAQMSPHRGKARDPGQQAGSVLMALLSTCLLLALLLLTPLRAQALLQSPCTGRARR